jgi:hypothetical protein
MFAFKSVTRRKWPIVLAIVVALLLGYPLIPLGWHIDIDVESARTRRSLVLGSIVLQENVEETELTEYVTNPTQPRWKPVRRSSLSGRTSFNYAKTLADIRQFVYETEGLSPERKQELALAVLDMLRQEKPREIRNFVHSLARTQSGTERLTD